MMPRSFLISSAVVLDLLNIDPPTHPLKGSNDVRMDKFAQALVRYQVTQAIAHIVDQLRDLVIF